MTADQLRAFKHKMPFKSFTIHLADGKSFEIDDPESLVLPRDWSTDAIVTMPKGRFSFIYLRNVTHVTGEGGFPRMRGRRGKGKGPDAE
jgi:hypothetical protein